MTKKKQLISAYIIIYVAYLFWRWTEFIEDNYAILDDKKY